MDFTWIAVLIFAALIIFGIIDWILISLWEKATTKSINAIFNQALKILILIVTLGMFNGDDDINNDDTES